MQLRTRLLSLWGQVKLPIMIILFLWFLIDTANSLRQGYFMVPPFQIETPVTWAVFQSDLRPISLPYPSDWSAHNTPGGYRGDKEAIAYIYVPHYDYPYIFIAYQKMPGATIEEVAIWGLQRLTPSIAKNSTCETAPLNEISIGGVPALLRICKYYATNLQDTYVQQVYLLRDGDAYIVEFFTSKENDSPELRDVFQYMTTNISVQ